MISTKCFNTDFFLQFILIILAGLLVALFMDILEAFFPSLISQPTSNANNELLTKVLFWTWRIDVAISL